MCKACSDNINPFFSSAYWKSWTLGPSIIHLTSGLLTEFPNHILPMLWRQWCSNSKSYRTSSALSGHVSELYGRTDVIVDAYTRVDNRMSRQLSRMPLSNQESQKSWLRNVGLCTEIYYILKIWWIQPRSGRQPSSFSRTHLSWPVSSLDVPLTEIIPLWFSNEDLSPLKLTLKVTKSNRLVTVNFLPANKLHSTNICSTATIVWQEITWHHV